MQVVISGDANFLFKHLVLLPILLFVIKVNENVAVLSRNRITQPLSLLDKCYLNFGRVVSFVGRCVLFV